MDFAKIQVTNNTVAIHEYFKWKKPCFFLKNMQWIFLFVVYALIQETKIVFVSL